MLVVVLVLFATTVVASLALMSHAAFSARAAARERARITAETIANAGIARAIACLNSADASACGNTGGSTYAGEPNVPIGDGTVDIAITTIDDTRRRVDVTARAPSAAGTITAPATTEVELAESRLGFAYGAQAGVRGIVIENNATIDGNVYSNADITGRNGSRITGDAFVARGVDATAAASVRDTPNEFAFGRSGPNTDIAQPFTVPTTGPMSAIVLLVRKVGQPPNATIRIVEDEDGTPDDESLASATLAASAVPTTIAWIRVDFATPARLTADTRYWLVVDAAAWTNDYWVSGFSFTAPGGVVTGDWRNGPWQSASGSFAHEVWTGGVDTALDGVAVNHNARAHRIANAEVGGSTWSTDLSRAAVGGVANSGTITSSRIGGNATAEHIASSIIGGNVWCETITNSTVGGARNCPTPVDPPVDPGPAAFPVTDAHIAEWIADAAAGGTTGSVHPRSGDAIRLGPVTVLGDLTLDNNQALTLTGTVHVTGRILVSNGGTVALDPAYGSRSGLLISDGPITIENNGRLRGSGDPQSSLAIISRSARYTASDPAVLLGNGVDGAIVIAPYGVVRLKNTVTITQITADGVILDQNAMLRYRTGFLDVRFSAGPTVAWTPVAGTWHR